MAQLLVAAEVPDGEHEVVAVRRGDDDLGLAEPEVPDDVVAHGWRRGCGEGEERRYHYRRSRQEERGKLVAEGLSAARWQDEEHVAAAKHRTDRALLLAMKTRDAEALPRHLPELVNPRGAGTHRRFESRLETFHRR